MYNEFEQAVINTVNNYNMISMGDSIVVGVSGGADSVALLALLCSLREKMKLTLTVVHVNHGIRGDEAKRDENYVFSLCNYLNVECIIKQCDVVSISKNEKISLELAGRNERYKAFYEIAKEKSANKIAVAHNKNDSAETILIKLTRGCSLNGLRGISPINGIIIRPLIETSRQDIENYLASKSISYVTDSTNNENIYTRNIIRNCVIPQLEKINPGFINTLYANSKNISCDDDFIENCAAKYYEKCVLVSNESVIVKFPDTEILDNAVKKRILLYAYSKINGDKNDIEQKHIDILINASSTGKIYNISGDVSVATEYGKLIFRKNNTLQKACDYCISIGDVNGREYGVNNIRIKFELIDNTGMRDKNCIYVDYGKLFGKKLILRNRRDGDKFIPYGMNSFKKLKKFFIDLKIPKQIRDTVPILCADDEIAAVIGYRVDNRYITNDKTKIILKISFLGGTNE